MSWKILVRLLKSSGCFDKFLPKNQEDIIDSSRNLDEKQRSLRGQTMHWIDAQFCVCMFLDSRDKPLNMLKFCRKDGKIREQKKNKGSVLVVESAYNSQKALFGLVMIAKCFLKEFWQFLKQMGIISHSIFFQVFKNFSAYLLKFNLRFSEKISENLGFKNKIVKKNNFKFGIPLL